MGDGDVGVPEALADDPGRDPGGQGGGGVAVADIMQPNLRESGSAGVLLEPPGEPLGVQWPAVGPGEHQPGVLPTWADRQPLLELPAPVLAEGGHGGRVESDRAVVLGGLWFAERIWWLTTTRGLRGETRRASRSMSGQRSPATSPSAEPWGPGQHVAEEVDPAALDGRPAITAATAWRGPRWASAMTSCCTSAAHGPSDCEATPSRRPRPRCRRRRSRAPRGAHPRTPQWPPPPPGRPPGG
jgi:hypothetical protein